LGEAGRPARGGEHVDVLHAAAHQLGKSQPRVGTGADDERGAAGQAAEHSFRTVYRDRGTAATSRADGGPGRDRLRAAEAVLEEVVEHRGGAAGAARGLKGLADLPGDLRLAEHQGTQARGDLVE